MLRTLASKIAAGVAGSTLVVLVLIGWCAPVARSAEPVHQLQQGPSGCTVACARTPGGRIKQNTFIRDYWLVATSDGQCVGVFKAAPESLAFF